MSEKLLMEVNDNVELYLYEGILKQNKIPYIIKRPNVRGYMKIIAGESHAVPAEIYVPEESFDSALELTEVIRSEKSQAPDSKENPGYKKRKLFAWVIIGMFGLMVLVYIIVELLGNK